MAASNMAASNMADELAAALVAGDVDAAKTLLEAVDLRVFGGRMVSAVVEGGSLPAARCLGYELCKLGHDDMHDDEGRSCWRLAVEARRLELVHGLYVDKEYFYGGDRCRWKEGDGRAIAEEKKRVAPLVAAAARGDPDLVCAVLDESRH